ncbi:linear amide C-N hydrolase [Saccharicrinis sp. FJH2]|uniref:linear amide C-N hydrolase n=1 Tax=Saccharicrinis sp. FJH65 TaxID=3344659 RepID=UPI0035F4542F
MILNKKNNRKISVIIVIGLLVANSLFACSTFVLSDSNSLVFGRNFDFDLGWGFIVINNRGIKKHAIVEAPYKPASWESKYGSITFNQIGVDAPMGGMNEKGLVIAQMGLFETKYPDIKGENVVNVLEWIQYQLDNSSTLDEVIQNSEKVNINPVEIMPVHYLVCDSLGNKGVIEFLNGKFVVVKGKDFSIPVCSNIPYYQSLITTKEYKPFGGDKEIPERWDNIPDIIAIANAMILDYRSSYNPIDYSFEILKAIGSEDKTQWSIVFDIKNREINYKTLNNKVVRKINLDDYNFTCENDIKILDIQENKSEIILPKNFKLLTYNFYYDYKAKLLEIFKTNINNFPEFPENILKNEIDYAMNRKCN